MILAAVMSTACGASEKAPQKEKESAAEESGGEGETADNGDETFGLNEAAVFDKLKMTALEMKEAQGDEYIKPAEGKVFVGVKFQIENISDEEQNVSSLLLFDAYVDGTKVDMEWMPPGDLSEGSLDGALAAGKNMQGYYVVQAGTDWSEIQLDVKSEWLGTAKAEFIFTK